MSNKDKEEMIVEFTDVTGVPRERAEFFLQSANWTLQLALASFFEDQDSGPEGTDVEMNETATAADTQSSSASSSSTQQNASEDTNKKQNNESTSVPRIVTLHNLSNSSSDSESEQGQAFYAGGSETSGQQVLGPPKKKENRKDFVTEVFKAARESGAVVEDEASTSSGRRSSGRMYTGTGYRLGQTDHDHVVLYGPSSRNTNRTTGRNVASRSDDDESEPIKLRLWKEGFSIDNGELRPFSVPANKQFMENIVRGEIPDELHVDGMPVKVDLEDHRDKNFVRIISKTKPFTGKGHMLGSPSPNVAVSKEPAPETNTPAATPPTVTNINEENETRANEQLNVNLNNPTTMIQVRLADGSRLSAQFNNTHTVNDVRNFLSIARPQYANRNYMLLTTFPSKELTDGSVTLEDGGLLNAAILQRLK